MSLVIAVAMLLTVMVFMPEDASAASKKPGKVKITSAVKLNQMITVTWKKTKKAKKYQIYLKQGKKKWKKVATVKANGKSTQTYAIKKLKWNTKYQVRVRAVNGKKKGKWSRTWGGKLVRYTTLAAEINKNADAKKYLDNVEEIEDPFIINVSIEGNTVVYKMTQYRKINGNQNVSPAEANQILNHPDLPKEMRSLATTIENKTGIFGIKVRIDIYNYAGTKVGTRTY